ncbi:MAG TPA: F0F1 ATP synthase subunit A [Terriglobia bacterium]|nr:F0F1 ATP synthase subunit A [Terriglobia bacterium]
MEHEIWFTAILNKIFGGAVTALLTKIATLHGLEWVRPADPAHPIHNYLAMEILVALLLIVLALVVRSRLSIEHPGTLQHVMEVLVDFVRSTAGEVIGHGADRYVPMLGTLFLFVMACNLLSLLPGQGVPVPAFGIEVSPTGYIQATLGCAVVVFLYYNYQGFRQQGILGYLKHFCGPILAMAIIMFPIEIISNVGRMLSLSVRLYANMLVGGLLEKVFGGLIPLVVPVIFMGLHLFVSLLQAYIFMLLPAVYLGLAVGEEH